MTTIINSKELEENLNSLDLQLNNIKTPLAQRFRALFTLKSIGNLRAIEIIGKGFDGQSALLGHELAYVLGQIKDIRALPILEKVLIDETEHSMVRHEAAEAMGAIGSSTSLKILKLYLNHSIDAIRETCEIAIAKIEWDNSEEGIREAGIPKAFPTIDPAPPSSSSSSPLTSNTKVSTLTIKELKLTLLNSNLSLFERYRAMFALRNDGGKEAVLALASGFEDKSALFRHEIAYVFGQLSSPHSVPSLIKVLSNSIEEDMVRHEAAEALGSIATEECFPILKEFARESEDIPRVVRESCLVALDMYEYENSHEFSYATPLVAVA